MVGLVWVRGGQKVGGGSRSNVAHDDVTEISQWWGGTERSDRSAHYVQYLTVERAGFHLADNVFFSCLIRHLSDCTRGGKSGKIMMSTCCLASEVMQLKWLLSAEGRRNCKCASAKQLADELSESLKNKMYPISVSRFSLPTVLLMQRPHFADSLAVDGHTLKKNNQCGAWQRMQVKCKRKMQN